ncbi:MAG: nicotinate-nucleotide--dimethylbenzimidazole phosphoribosyltransferase, partial [Nocardioides sp.]
DVPAGDDGAAAAVAARAAQVIRPAGALARLDELAAWVARWQGTASPAVDRPACLVFGADHGVAAAGVSAYPAEVTAAMKDAITRGKATINAMGRVAGVEVSFVDVGVGDPTGDIRFAPALDEERAARVTEVAVDAVHSLDADLLVIGELGIGNTTAAAAVAAALVGGDVAGWVGRGTGVDGEGLARKREAVRTAVRRIEGVRDPLEILRELGGAELIATAAAIAAARHRGLPVLLDGYVITAAAAALAAANPDALAHCRAGHCSAEPGHQRLLGHLGLEPLLRLDLRLGEGSGALAAVPLVRMACAAVVEVPTFAEWFG